MTRMIERWFPCTEVGNASMVGWGSGNTEASLWVWFAKRPAAQAKAAVLTSLLPWPDDERAQRELQRAVRKVIAVNGPATARSPEVRHALDVIRDALHAAYPAGASILDPFSGRAIIPLEAGRLGVRAEGIDYSPFAALGGSLLAEVPFQDWTGEPQLPFEGDGSALLADDRLLRDVEGFLAEAGRRYMATMADFYPKHEGAYPWGYLWASSLPCEECGNRFPLVGELQLRNRRPPTRKRLGEDIGQSFEIEADRRSGRFRAVVHPGEPIGTPTRVFAGKSKYSAEGRVAVCPFCGHVHPKAAHTRLSAQGLRRDVLLVAADIAEDGTRVFREPDPEEFAAPEYAARALSDEPPFGSLSALPDERIPPGNTWTIQSVNYGDKSYGDLIQPRQALGLVRLSRIINNLSEECLKSGISPLYVRALSGYATAVMMRKLRRSTRASRLDIGRSGVGDVFANQSSILHSYDWFESGLSEGSGSWSSLAKKTVTAVREIRTRAPALPAVIQRGSATMLPQRDRSVDAIVTDPPYDDMIDYSDSSDLFYVWAKRAMLTADFSLAMTMHPDGVQEKGEEIIVKRGGKPAADHRTQEHFKAKIGLAYEQMRRVVTDDGIVTIVFAHGDLQVWDRMLRALDEAELVMTASWPAKTEAGGGGAGAMNIVITVTMACRPAPTNRPPGNLARVENQIRNEIADRIRLWERSDLERADMLMASAGPAMEVAGLYSVIRDNTGTPVNLVHLLGAARRTVMEILLSKIDKVPLERFDERTKFALWWVEQSRRDKVAKSELRWASLTSSLPVTELQTLVTSDSKGCRFVFASEARTKIEAESSVIDIVLAMAREWRTGGSEEVAGVLVAAGRDGDDELVWATTTHLVERLPDADPDAVTWSAMMGKRTNIETATRSVRDDRIREAREIAAQQLDNTLF
jgi:putative DNA methylase